MKVLHLNSVYGSGSTGRIVESIHSELIELGHESIVVTGRSKPRFNNDIDKNTVIDLYSFNDLVVHAFGAVMFDKHGLYSNNNTKKIIDIIKNFKPDIIQLHNIHGFYLNYNLLFNYLNTININIVWTLHDCWAYTGYCAYYDFNECSEWLNGCNKCKFRNVYPYRLLGNTKNNYNMKKNLFENSNNLYLITPSNWLKNEVSKSFMSKLPIKVINNGIDSSKFYYDKTYNMVIDIKGLLNKKILLGVAGVWTKQKGFDEYLRLSSLISSDYIIVLIGVNVQQIKKLEKYKNIIGIEKTKSLDELRQWYSSAHFFVNLTLEDNYPTVNLEAISCGLRVISYDSGGCFEIASSYGETTTKYDIEMIYQLILKDKTYEQSSLVMDNKKMLVQYVEEYANLVK